jgi:hypothetical protein
MNFKIKSFAMAIALGCFSSLNINIYSSKADSPPDANQIQEIVGFTSAGQRSINFIAIPDYTYVGQCPGYKWDHSTGWFISSQHPPAPNQTVTITNISIGTDPNNQPFTIRDYSKGSASENIDFTFGSDQNDRWFHVLEGDNTFEYVIKSGNQVIKNGIFHAQINRNAISIARYPQPQLQNVTTTYQYCDASGNHCREGTKTEQQTVYVCPY